MKQFEIVTEPIQTEQYREFTINEYQGAVVVFTGHVGRWTKGVKTEYLEYEAYIPMAEKKLAQIGDEINEKWPGTITSIVHRKNRAITNFRYRCINCGFFTAS